MQQLHQSTVPAPRSLHNCLPPPASLALPPGAGQGYRTSLPVPCSRYDVAAAASEQPTRGLSDALFDGPSVSLASREGMPARQEALVPSQSHNPFNHLLALPGCRNRGHIEAEAAAPAWAQPLLDTPDLASLFVPLLSLQQRALPGVPAASMPVGAPGYFGASAMGQRPSKQADSSGSASPGAATGSLLAPESARSFPLHIGASLGAAAPDNTSVQVGIRCKRKIICMITVHRPATAQPEPPDTHVDRLLQSSSACLLLVVHQQQHVVNLQIEHCQSCVFTRTHGCCAAAAAASLACHASAYIPTQAQSQLRTWNKGGACLGLP